MFSVEHRKFSSSATTIVYTDSGGNITDEHGGSRDRHM